MESQRLLADAESLNYRALAEYAIALKNVHYSKGTLLDYDGVMLSESGWPAKAYDDAAEREASRGRRWPMNYASSRAPIVSQGTYDQQSLQDQLVPLAPPAEGDGAPMEPIMPGEPVPPAAPIQLEQPAAPTGDASPPAET